MTKTEMLRKVRANIAQEKDKKIACSDIDMVLKGYANVIVAALQEDPQERIPFDKIGAFKGKYVAGRKGTSALTGKSWATNERNELTFKVSPTRKVL